MWIRMSIILAILAGVSAGADEQQLSYKEYLRGSALDREVIRVFLDEDTPTWAQFDAELGYVLNNSMPRDGVDGSRTFSTVQSSGARTQLAYPDRPCRINTYGNSFTQCHQASDGETWQEVLAAHFGEPIRNFGMGGYGTYQAYRRMVREEQTDLGAEYVILYLWGDDYLRSVMRTRHALIYKLWGHDGGRMFHNNFWANIEIDLDTGEWIEPGNRLPTHESLYKMCDPDYMVDALRDDMLVMTYSGMMGWARLNEAELSMVDQLASQLEQDPVDRTSDETIRGSLDRIMNAYGFAATRQILKKAQAFCDTRGKKLLVLTLCPTVIRQLLGGFPRYDQPIMDYLESSGMKYVDMNLAHVRDYEAFKIDVESYMARYFIGHYNPTGNHFFAFQLKDTLVNWLDPKPITYRTTDWKISDFRGYLPSP